MFVNAPREQSSLGRDYVAYTAKNIYADERKRSHR